MRRTFILLFTIAITCFSCGKEKPTINISYTDFNDAIISDNHLLSIDIDKDGANDFLIATRLINSNNEDHLQFVVTSIKGNRILLQDEQLPKKLDQGEIISSNDQPPFVWTALGNAILVEKVMPQDVSKTYCQGTWKDQNNRFLPIQLVKGSNRYNGWIRISFNPATPDQILVHDAAYHKTASAIIKAGQQ